MRGELDRGEFEEVCIGIYSVMGCKYKSETVD